MGVEGCSSMWEKGAGVGVTGSNLGASASEPEVFILT